MEKPLSRLNYRSSYSIFVFAAHTGAKQSLFLRTQLDDVDLTGSNATTL